jgi:hypothetical protein
MTRKAARHLAVATVLALALSGCTRPSPTISPIPAPTDTASAAAGPGAEGIGDAYFPLAGNGGYDVGDYDIDVTYDPASRELTGRATIAATATGTLTSFDLDYTGPAVSSMAVNGMPARWEQHENGELVVTPASTLPAGSTFTRWSPTAVSLAPTSTRCSARPGS